MPSSAAQLLIEQGERSGLIAPNAAQAALALLTVDEAITTEKVAEHLVAKKALTAYQAEQLLIGKGEECVIAGRYQVLDKLGEGGMGTVYKARDTNLDRVVAVKVLPAGRLHDGDAVARFQREAKALARLSHPHIIQAFDSGADRGRHFLVMEFVEGLTLDKVLRQHGALSPALAADLIYQAAIGLQHAHEKGLIHRDLKPANLLVAGLKTTVSSSVEFRETADYPGNATPVHSSPTTPSVKILDLGLARFLQDQMGEGQLTQEGTGMGTPDYMAPEQFRDALHADAHTDIYGLGCTLYHLLAGQVPFPGTSFSEKARAHAKKEPIPLEERCPEIPAGLAFIVQKMMAKHPAERYQSVGEVAEALAPHVAGNSHSVIRMRQTGKWPPGQLTMVPARRATRVIPWAVGAAALVVAGLLLVVAWPQLFPADSKGSDPNQIAKLPEPDRFPAKKEDPPKNDATPKAVESTKAKEPVKPKIVTIPNGLTVAKNGTGQFTTINKALEKIEPGMTIRVLDDAVYPESLHLNRASAQSGITIEATAGATLSFPAGVFGMLIQNAPKVTVRGFRLEHAGNLNYMIAVAGKSQGLHLANLDMKINLRECGAITIEGLEPKTDVNIIENCTINGGRIGVRISGYLDYATPSPCANVVIRNNTFLGSLGGILVTGSLQNIQIVGNRVAFAPAVAIQLENIMPGSEQILVANNTVVESQIALRVWDIGDKTDFGKKVTLANNLFLLSVGPDSSFIDSGGDPGKIRGAGPGKSLLNLWTWEKNWRETTEPKGSDIHAKSWIPIAAADTRRDKIDVLSRDVRHANFVKPAKNSPLAKAGKGGLLPTWVGAVPPDDTAPWNWQWTWDAFVNSRLTVSKDAKTGGFFRSLNAALDRVRPGMTIRVLDKETYAEKLTLTNPATQAGITIESPLGALISADQPKGSAIFIKDVPNLTLRGFRVRADAARLVLIEAKDRATGLLLDSLTFEAGSGTDYDGVFFHNFDHTARDAPAVVQNCTFIKAQIGFGAAGIEFLVPGASPPCRGFAVRNNLFLEPTTFGIQLNGYLESVQVVGNRFARGAKLSAIQLTDLSPDTRDVLLANNTICDVPHAFRIWDSKVKGKRIQFCNNLFLGVSGPDMMFLDSGGSPDKIRGPGDGLLVHKAWLLSHNWRKTRVPAGRNLLAKSWIPPGANDLIKEQIDVMSRVPGDADFLKPPANSPLATAGIGGDLPRYVGAIPPVGVPPCNWKEVWLARLKKKMKGEP